MNTLGTVICFGIIMGFVAVIAVIGTRSRLRFARYLQSMNREEKIKFTEKNFRFITIFGVGAAIGILGILSSLVFNQEYLANFFFLGLFVYFLVMAMLAELFIYRVPKNRK
ncbi:MAG TPA: hypothetical protein VFQ23_04470 [Anaerolineales bacterium]|nr:hypothetical protein [Anaerolineales bacterium]